MNLLTLKTNTSVKWSSKICPMMAGRSSSLKLGFSLKISGGLVRSLLNVDVLVVTSDGEDPESGKT